MTHTQTLCTRSEQRAVGRVREAPSPSLSAGPCCRGQRQGRGCPLGTAKEGHQGVDSGTAAFGILGALRHESHPRARARPSFLPPSCTGGLPTDLAFCWSWGGALEASIPAPVGEAAPRPPLRFFFWTIRVGWRLPSVLAGRCGCRASSIPSRPCCPRLSGCPSAATATASRC